jgi:hypothetical protein
VQLTAVQGAYAEQSFPMGFLPLLIEDDSDYEFGAKAIVRHWAGISTAIKQLGDKK